MKIKKNLIINLVLVFLLGAVVLMAREWLLRNFVFSIDGRGDYKEYVSYGGLARSYVVHEPENETGLHADSLVFILHGVGSNAEAMMKISDMNTFSDRGNFIAVYPNGTGLFSNYLLSWNAGQCCDFVEPLGVDDVGFINFLTDKLSAKYRIDKNKVYVAGFSNGGMMAYRLGCELSDKIAAVASVAGSMMVDKCEPAQPVSVLAFHGGEDKTVPFGGGTSRKFIVDLFNLNFKSAADSVLFWVRRDSCSLIPQKTSFDDGYRELYFGCEKGTNVLLFTFGSYGHVWPGGKKIGTLVKEAPSSISASEAIWSFFSRHPKE